MFGDTGEVDHPIGAVSTNLMRIALMLVMASFAAAAQPRMLAPVAGYVFDGSAGSIRAVVGVPGAASAGDRLPLNDSFSTAFLHPALAVAVGMGKDGSVVVANWADPAHPRQAVLTPRFGAPDRIVFAANADKAMLISASGVELWSALTSDPVVLYFYTSAALGGSPGKAALSSDGALAAIVLDSSRIVETSSDGLRQAGEGRSAVYAPGLFILTTDGALSTGGNTLASGLESDAELTVMTGYNGVVALSRQSGRLSLIDVYTGQLTSVDCGGCQPARPQTLATPGLLYFEDAERGGLLLDSTVAARPRIVPLAGIDGRRNQ